MGRLRAPGPILLLVVSSMVMECGALASHPPTEYLVAANGQVPPDPGAPSVSPTATPQPSWISSVNTFKSAPPVSTRSAGSRPWATRASRRSVAGDGWR